MTHPVPLPARGWYPDPAGVPQRLRYWNGRHWGDTTWTREERIATHRLPKRVREGGITLTFVLWLLGLPAAWFSTQLFALFVGFSGGDYEEAIWTVGIVCAVTLIGLTALILVGSRKPTAPPPTEPGVTVDDVRRAMQHH